MSGFSVDVHAVADALVEVQFDHAAGLIVARQRGFGGGQVGGVLRAYDAEQAAQRDGVGGVRFDARGQCAGVFVGVGAAGVFVGDGLGGDGRGAVHAGDFGVNIGVVVGYRRGVGGDEAEGGGLGQDGGFELVVPDEEVAVGAGYEVGFWHKFLGFSGLYGGLVGVSGPFGGANGRSVGANERLVGAHGSRVEAN